MSERELKLDILKLLFAPTLFAVGILPSIFLLIMVKIPLEKSILRVLWALCATLIYIIFSISYMLFRKTVERKYMHVDTAKRMVELCRRGVIAFGAAIAALWVIVILTY